ncbi:MAG: nicotinate-nucleotide adenylyltransferase [Gammaproteobacteria bacterium]|nr:nicotinate-nucleotide adenylyltransferase [Gammaproteobacteria bacterium]MBU1558188.1 nicotinate-nucleotide adenylyltransferase [Gammaproteobacteria bacterium]MBU1628749.1 nicotinate-nucleotide adenylyltransferase [Gammaproteobacteria bacterium]MBU1926591.1 nicotinate-nucleotide adenylyltransferase [Gammaproteobacteria bacterium]MBU2545638.1 nicotinate-nucleotide adenylyltransferase [Gammaproteobacteria bacterium]
MNKQQRTGIGILGGTFDPVHFGHLKLAEFVYERLPLQEIRFIPCYQPVHREQPAVNVMQRLEMLKIALKTEKHCVLDLKEIERKGPSYMIETLISLRHDYPKQPLYLILGADAFAKIDSWHRWEELLQFTHIVVVNRPQTPVRFNAVIQHLMQEHMITNLDESSTRLHGNIIQLSMPAIPISATELRNTIARNKKPKNALSEAVWKYIQENNLYR